jgi:hypothetical protein
MLHRVKARAIEHFCLPQEACRPGKSIKASQQGRTASLLGKKCVFGTAPGPSARLGSNEENPPELTYHGNWHEQANSNGMKIRAKRIGACP